MIARGGSLNLVHKCYVYNLKIVSSVAIEKKSHYFHRWGFWGDKVNE